MASPAVDFARSNQQRFLNELKDLLRIPSVSTLEEHKPDIKKAADYVANELRRIGMENVEVIPTKGHPLIYADWLHAAGKPTVLCYAHYDVQPAEPLDEWHTQLREWQERYPLRYEQLEDGPLKPQHVVERLSAMTGGDAIIVAPGRAARPEWGQAHWP